MQNRDLENDYEMSSSDSSSRMGSRSRPSDDSGMSRRSTRDNRVRNSSRENSSDMPARDEDLQRQQIEGNLGNERVRSRGDE